MESRSIPAYDRVDPDEIIEKLKRIIEFLQIKSLEKGNEKELQTSLKN